MASSTSSSSAHSSMASSTSSSSAHSSVLSRYLMACAAASLSEAVTYPLDLVKVLLQLQNARGQALRGAPAAPLGMSALLRGMAAEGALFAGLPIAVLRQCFNAGTSVGLYPTVRGALLAPGEDKERMPLHKRALAGAATGCLGQALAQPTDVIKTRIQADTRLRAAGLPPRYQGARDALARILAAEGVAGLYTALGSSVWRAGIINAAGIASYDGTKQAAVQWVRGWGGSSGGALAGPRVREHLPSVVAALVCGVVSAVVSCPLDVVKTRMMNSPGRYTGPNDAFVQLVRSEGAASMFKGFLPTYYRQALWNGVFWVTLEAVQRGLGLESI